MPAPLAPSRRAAHPPGRGAFTLIELLVVVSIVSLLVALLLPGLKNARNAAKRAVCLTQQRQIATAVQLYADDHKEWFPFASYASAQTLLGGPAGTPNPDLENPPWLPRYLPTGYVRFCPSGDPTIPKAPGENPGHFRPSNPKGGAFGYRIVSAIGSQLTGTSNRWYGWDAGQYVAGISQMPIPRRTFAGTSQPGLSSAVLYSFPPPNLMGSVVDLFNPDERPVWLRTGFDAKTINHPGERGQNVTFLDGHGRWSASDQVQPRTRFWAWAVGTDWEVWW